MSRSSTLTYLRSILASAGWLSLLLVLAAGLIAGENGAAWPNHERASAIEEATPDCGAVAAAENPACEQQAQLKTLGVGDWHARGIRGEGVKVAILDTGFRGYRDALGKFLPARVTTRCFRPDADFEARDSQHGVLCAEIVHTLVPDAELFLATWEPNSPEQFVQAVEWARRQGVRVISCSVIMPSWSDGEGGGPVHEAMGKALGTGRESGDMICVASAGNTAQRHWTGPFKDGGDGYHQWREGLLDNRIRPWGNERVSVELCCPTDARYQVQVFDSTLGTEIGRSTAGTPPGRRCAVVRFTPEPGHRYRARVRHLEAKGNSLEKNPFHNDPFHLVVLGGDLDCTTARGSIPFPGDGARVLAVGAVDKDGKRMSYSSCGPNSPHPKPDFVATVPFVTLGRDRPFTGTSAAAPQVAGLAALCWSRHPEWTAAKVRESLRAWARDLGEPGHDCETGFGMIVLPAP